MNRERGFAKNTAILLIGTFLPKLVSFITLPILTGYLSKSDYGTYDLILTLVSLVLPAATLQIQSAAFRFLIDCRNDIEKGRKIVATIFYFTLIISSITIIVVYFVLREQPAMTRVLICCYFLFDILYLVFQQVARGLGYNILYSISVFINSILSAVFIIATVKQMKMGLDGVLIASNVGLLIGSIVIVISTKMIRQFNPRFFDKSCLSEMLKYSWPMVPNNLSRWVLDLSDRLVVTFFIGVEGTAVLAVANKIPNLINCFQSAFTAAWQENASISVKDSDTKEYYSAMFDASFCMFAGATAILIACTPIIFFVLIRADYDESYTLMTLYFLGAFCSLVSGFLGGIYVAHRETKSVGITTIVAAAVNLVVDLILISFIGLFAASISTLISYFLLMIFRMTDVRKIQPMSYNIGKIVILIVILAIMCILTAQRQPLLNIINAIIGIVVAVMFNKNVILAIYRCNRKHS